MIFSFFSQRWECFQTSKIVVSICFPNRAYSTFWIGFVIHFHITMIDVIQVNIQSKKNHHFRIVINLLKMYSTVIFKRRKEILTIDAMKMMSKKIIVHFLDRCIQVKATKSSKHHIQISQPRRGCYSLIMQLLPVFAGSAERVLQQGNIMPGIKLKICQTQFHFINTGTMRYLDNYAVTGISQELWGSGKQDKCKNSCSTVQTFILGSIFEETIISQMKRKGIEEWRKFKRRDSKSSR